MALILRDAVMRISSGKMVFAPCREWAM